MDKRLLIHLHLAGIAFILAGCAKPLWLKPGASQEDFGRDKYECMQHSQQRVSGTYVNAYGGASTNKIITNEGLFNACMNSKGWTLQSTSSIEQAQAQSRQRFEENTFRQEDLVQQRKALCDDKRFEAYFTKTACKTSDLSLAQLSDSSKITTAQKRSLDQLSPEINSINKETLELQRNSSAKNLSARLSTLQNSIDAGEKNRLNLYAGKITWGQYNSTRKEISKELASRMNAINQGK